jgi:hypothetical protein
MASLPSFLQEKEQVDREREKRDAAARIEQLKARGDTEKETAQAAVRPKERSAERVVQQGEEQRLGRAAGRDFETANAILDQLDRANAQPVGTSRTALAGAVQGVTAGDVSGVSGVSALITQLESSESGGLITKGSAAKFTEIAKSSLAQGLVRAGATPEGFARISAPVSATPTVSPAAALAGGTAPGVVGMADSQPAFTNIGQPGGEIARIDPNVPAPAVAGPPPAVAAAPPAAPGFLERFLNLFEGGGPSAPTISGTPGVGHVPMTPPPGATATPGPGLTASLGELSDSEIALARSVAQSTPDPNARFAAVVQAIQSSRQTGAGAPAGAPLPPSPSGGFGTLATPRESLTPLPAIKETLFPPGLGERTKPGTLASRPKGKSLFANIRDLNARAREAENTRQGEIERTIRGGR